MFSASLPPSIIASVRASLARLRADGPAIMKTLWKNVDTLYDALAAKGFPPRQAARPVVAVHINGPELAAMAWHGCSLTASM